MNCEFLLNDMLIESVGPPEPQVKTKPVNSGLFHVNIQFSWRLECIDVSFVGESTLNAGEQMVGETTLSSGWQRGDRDPVSRTNFNKIHAWRFESVIVGETSGKRKTRPTMKYESQSSYFRIICEKEVNVQLVICSDSQNVYTIKGKERMGKSCMM